jgi:hypothetical protein
VAVDLAYTVQTQYPTVIFLGGTQTQDAMAVGIITNGHGIYLEFRIPRTTYSAAQVKSFATGYTGTVEAVAGIAGVAGVAWSQIPDATGQLADVLTLTVESDSGNSSATLTIHTKDWTPHAAGPKVTALIAQLNEAEAAGAA